MCPPTQLVFVPEEPFLSVLYLFKASLVHTTKWENDSFYTLIYQYLWIWKEADCMLFARQEQESETQMTETQQTIIQGLICLNSLANVSKFTCWLEWAKKNRKKHQRT